MDPLLAVGHTGIFNRNHGMIEHCVTASKIQPMAADIGLTLFLVPGDHALNVATKKQHANSNLHSDPEPMAATSAGSTASRGLPSAIAGYHRRSTTAQI